jgi:hypothetical protein
MQQRGHGRRGAASTMLGLLLLSCCCLVPEARRRRKKKVAAPQPRVGGRVALLKEQDGERFPLRYPAADGDDGGSSSGGGAEREFSVHRVSSRPAIFVVDDFLDQGSCDRLIELALASPTLAEAEVNWKPGSDLSEGNAAWRRSSSAWLPKVRACVRACVGGIAVGYLAAARACVGVACRLGGRWTLPWAG